MILFCRLDETLQLATLLTPQRKKPDSKLPIPVQLIERRIFLIRGKKVIIDSDLSELYGVQTKVFNQAVKRNRERFPEDFMFRLSNKEAESLRSQIVTSNPTRGGRRYLPFVFTEQGVAMLSSVLNTKRAIEVNIAIMRAFVKLREILESNEQLNRKFAAGYKKTRSTR